MAWTPHRPFMAPADYLASCHHWPKCRTCWGCGRRRQIDEAVRDGRLTQGQATRLVRLYLQEGRD